MSYRCGKPPVCDNLWQPQETKPVTEIMSIFMKPQHLRHGSPLPGLFSNNTNNLSALWPGYGWENDRNTRRLEMARGGEPPHFPGCWEPLAAVDGTGINSNVLLSGHPGRWPPTWPTWPRTLDSGKEPAFPWCRCSQQESVLWYYGHPLAGQCPRHVLFVLSVTSHTC